MERLSVTVVTRRRARPGQAEALLALASERIVQPGRPQAGRLWTRLFQGLDDPHVVVRVGHWQSRDAYCACSAAQ